MTPEQDSTCQVCTLKISKEELALLVSPGLTDGTCFKAKTGSVSLKDPYPLLSPPQTS